MHSQLRCQNSLPLNKWVRAQNVWLKLFRIFSNSYPVEWAANIQIPLCGPQFALERESVIFLFCISFATSSHQTAIFAQLISPSKSIFCMEYCSKCFVIEMEIVEVMVMDANRPLFHWKRHAKFFVIQFFKLLVKIIITSKSNILIQHVKSHLLWYDANQIRINKIKKQFKF